MRYRLHILAAVSLLMSFTMVLCWLGSRSLEDPGQEALRTAEDDRGEDSHFSPPSSPPSDELADIRPDFTLAIVNNMERYLDDCGCAGDQIGGLARVVSAAKLVDSDNLYIIMGGESAPSRADQQPFHERLLDARSQLTTPLFWLAASDSGTRNVEPRSESNQLFSRLSALGVTCTIGMAGEIVLTTNDSTLLFNSSSLTSRGRALCFIGFWNVGAAGRANIVASMGPLFASAVNGSHRALGLTRELLKERAGIGSLISKWTVTISRSVRPDKHVAELVEKVNLHLFHSAQTAIPAFPDMTEARHQLAGQLCGGCHQQQVTKWESSTHSRALSTLMVRRRQSDMRCLNCHVTAASVKPSGHLLGVFCNACHSTPSGAMGSSVSSSWRCESCHTGVTDPSANWKAHIVDVCAPGVGHNGDCVLGQLPVPDVLKDAHAAQTDD